MKIASLVFLGLFWSLTEQARSNPLDEQVFEFSADKYYSNFDTRETTAEGNVKVAFSNKKISADKVKMNSQTGMVEAEGKVVFEQGPAKVFGDSVKMDMRSGLGTFYNGRVDVEDGVTIEGKELGRISLDRYRVVNGKVSTCHDCPQSWSMAGSTLDIQIEGYAEIHHALFQISDTPVAYFPVVYFPVKTKRQSGFLIPQFISAPEIGAGVYVPYFWAISNDSDATITANTMTKGGNRLLTEYRKYFSDRTYVSGLASFGNINQLEGVPYIRYGYSLGQRWQITPNWSQRFRGELASDGKYTQHYYKEFSQTRLPSLVNEASVGWQNYNLTGFGRVELHQDNIPRDAGRYSPPPGSPRGHIHRLPHIGLAQPSYQLWGPVLMNSNLEYSNFTRTGANFDPYATRWIRTGERSTLTLRLSSPETFQLVKWEPSIEARGDFYRFPGLTRAPNNAYRMRYLLEQKGSLEFWRVFQTGGDEIPSLKHTLVPFVSWTYSDNDRRSKHPFFDKEQAPRFDLFDPESEAPQVQLGTITEEQKLKPNHIATFGTSTRLIARQGLLNPSYADLFTASAEREYNFRLQDFGRYRFSATLGYWGLRLSSSLALNPDNGDNDLQNSISLEKQSFKVEAGQTESEVTDPLKGKVKKIKSYSWSAELKNIGPFTITGMMVYEGLSNRITDQAYSIEFFSASKCWVFGLGARQSAPSEKWAYAPRFDITYRESIKKGVR